MSLFDLGIWSGKMCREPSQAENQKEQILRESSKKSVVYRRSPYLYLDRRMGHGLLPGLFWDRNSLLLGGYWTLNFGESPRDAEESSLSQILEATVPERYYLIRKRVEALSGEQGTEEKSCRRSSVPAVQRGGASESRKFQPVLSGLLLGQPDQYRTPLTSREAAAAALEKSQAFVRNFGSSFENLFFYGDTGVGKTFLSHCIARELIEQSFCVIYFTIVFLSKYFIIK